MVATIVLTGTLGCPPVTPPPGEGAGEGAGEGVGEGAGEPADVVAAAIDASFIDPTDPDDPGWAVTPVTKTVDALVERTSGNPSLGGHGPVGAGGKDLQIQAAHDGSTLYMRFLWPDATRNDTDRKWTFSATGWSSSGDEDRLYVMWPIQDAPGRLGMTFAEIGCAMSCHQRDETDTSTLVPNIVDAVEDCSVCHMSPGAVVGRTPPFEHRRFLFDDITVITQADCGTCHSPDYLNTVIAGSHDSADMIAPAGAALDIWHWKAQRSNPLGIAEDQSSADATRRGRDESNVAPDNKTTDGGGSSIPEYIWVDAAASGANPLFQSAIDAGSALLAGWNSTTEQYENLDDGTPVVPTDGDNVSRHRLQDGILGADASTNVGANGVHDAASETWAVVLWRSFASTDPDPAPGAFDTDIDFNTGGIHPFSVAFTNKSGIAHNGVAGPLTLGIE